MSDSPSGRKWSRLENGLYVPVGMDASGLGAGSAGWTYQGEWTPSRRTGNVIADVVPYVIGATPLLVPLLAIGMLGDPAVMRAVLWQGNLAALFVAMVQELLPLVVASAIFTVVYRTSGRQRFRAAAASMLVGAGLLLVFTSLPLAIMQCGILVAFLLLARPKEREWLRSRRRTFALAIVLIASLVGGYAWAVAQDSPWQSRTWEVLRARALYGLPREVAVQKSGEVTIYYLVASDDRQTTTITGYPNNVAVISIRTDDIVARLPCRAKQQGSARSIADMVLAPQQRGGTPYCGDLAECLRTTAGDITQTTAINRCTQRASGLPSNAFPLDPSAADQQRRPGYATPREEGGRVDLEALVEGKRRSIRLELGPRDYVAMSCHKRTPVQVREALHL